jgi:soluble lytic murein transglycosylase-like protein
MRRRLLALLVVALISGAVAGTVANAKGRPDTSNLLAGARYLAQMLRAFQSTDLALAAYNAGPTAVADAGGAPTQEALDYVANVTSLWRDLRGCR